MGFHSFDYASHVVLSATKFVYMLQCHSPLYSSINAIVPHVCVKQLIGSFQSIICNLPLNLQKSAPRGAMSVYQSTGFIQRHRGALLFVDISGVMELSQRFNVKDFKKFIEDYFTKIIEFVNSFGGEVVKYAGDALIAIWISTKVPHEFNGNVSSMQWNKMMLLVPSTLKNAHIICYRNQC